LSLTLQGFDELTENEKDELFENSIQAYVQYPKELKQKEKNVATKIASHAWRMRNQVALDLICDE
jgi:hypothetical protein